MKNFAYGVIGLLALVMTGCATVIHGTTQDVEFVSTPVAATATVGPANGLTQSVTTPGRLTLSRALTYEVTFEKPGYLPAHAHIAQSDSGAFWGNLLLGGLIGMSIDRSNGAAFNLEPETVSTTLVPDPSTAPSNEDHPISDSPPPPPP